MVLNMNNDIDINCKYLDHVPPEDFDITTTMVATCAEKLNNNFQGSMRIDFIGGTRGGSIMVMGL